MAQRLPRLGKWAQSFADSVDRIGGQAQFYARTVISIGDAVTATPLS